MAKGKVTSLRGKVIELKGQKYFPSLSPLAGTRSPSARTQLQADFIRLGKLLRGEARAPEAPTFLWEVVETPEQLEAMAAHLEECGAASFDVETSGFNFRHDTLYMLGIATVKRAFLIGIDWPGHVWAHGKELIGQVLGRLRIKWVAHNGVFDAAFVRHHLGWEVVQTFDTMLSQHVLDENSALGLKPLSKLHFDAEDFELPQPMDPAKVKFEDAGKYCALDCHYTIRLYEKDRALLLADPPLARLYSKLVMPATRTFEAIERRGIPIDVDRLNSALDHPDTGLRREVARLRTQLDDAVGKQVDWASSKQVSALLYAELKLDVLKRTKSGNGSTDYSTLQQLKGTHPVVDAMLKWREKVKLLQFLEKWNLVCENGRLYPRYKLHGTVTGRLSSNGPNIQQVPKDGDLRSLFCAPPGFQFIEADYSQVEVRLVAVASGDPVLIRLYQEGKDVHRNTGGIVLQKPPEELTDYERFVAKSVVFGKIYGMGWQKYIDYARDEYGVTVTPEQAILFHELFFTEYAALPQWHERQRKLARRDRFVRSPMGRIRHLPEVDSWDKQARAEALRQAINSPIQAWASDMMLFSIVRIEQELRGLAECVGAVHDAGLFTVPENRVDEAAGAIKRIMEDTETMTKTFGCHYTVPIEAEVKIGPWGAGKKWRPA